MSTYKGPKDYNDVASRIVEFRMKHPEGSLQQHDLQFVNVNGKDWVVYTAAAYRTPDDIRPGMGTAWEPIPGPTSFTKDSEVQNAETAAWGRAMMAALAVDAKKGIATSDEILARQVEVPAPAQNKDWVAEIKKLKDDASAYQLFNEARTQKAPADILEAIKEKARTFAEG